MEVDLSDIAIPARLYRLEDCQTLIDEFARIFGEFSLAGLDAKEFFRDIKDLSSQPYGEGYNLAYRKVRLQMMGFVGSDCKGLRYLPQLEHNHAPDFQPRINEFNRAVVDYFTRRKTSK